MAKTARHYSRMRRPRTIDDAKLRRLWGSHLTDALLAEEMGHDAKTLRRRAAKIGLPSSRRELWKQEEQR